MATINNLISVNTGQNSIRNNQNQMNDLKEQINRAGSQEERERLAELRGEQVSAAIQAGINTANNVSTLFSYMNNSNSGVGGNSDIWGSGTFDTSVFFESGGELSTLQAMNSARIGIENRARTLAGEIGRDRARGFDVSDRQEALSNLTGNLDILNRNLSNSIDRALSDDGGREGNFVDIVGRLRESLAPNEVPEQEIVAEGVVVGDAGVPEAPTQPPSDNFAEVPDSPGFAVDGPFEGSSVSEQMVEASEEPTPDEMSIAAQIASTSQAEHAESIDIMNEEIPETAVEIGVTPANV